MSGLDMRDAAGWAKGGRRRPAIIPGNAEGSLLYKAVKREGELQTRPGKGAFTPTGGLVSYNHTQQHSFSLPTHSFASSAKAEQILVSSDW